MMRRFMKPVNALLLLSLFATPIIANAEAQTDSQASAQVKGSGSGVMQSDLGKNVEFHLDSHSNQDQLATRRQ
jgi:hypothetical protein